MIEEEQSVDRRLKKSKEKRKPREERLWKKKMASIHRWKLSKGADESTKRGHWRETVRKKNIYLKRTQEV